MQKYFGISRGGRPWGPKRGRQGSLLTPCPPGGLHPTPDLIRHNKYLYPDVSPCQCAPSHHVPFYPPGGPGFGCGAFFPILDRIRALAARRVARAGVIARHFENVQGQGCLNAKDDTPDSNGKRVAGRQTCKNHQWDLASRAIWGHGTGRDRARTGVSVG